MKSSQDSDCVLTRALNPSLVSKNSGCPICLPGLSNTSSLVEQEYTRVFCSRLPTNMTFSGASKDRPALLVLAAVLTLVAVWTRTNVLR